MDAGIRCTKRIHDRAKVEWKEQIENLVLLAGVAERRHGQRAGAAAAGNVAAAEGRLLAGGDGEVQGRHHHERDGDRRGGGEAGRDDHAGGAGAAAVRAVAAAPPLAVVVCAYRGVIETSRSTRARAGVFKVRGCRGWQWMDGWMDQEHY